MAPRKKQARPPRRKPGTGTIRFKKGRERPWEAEFPTRTGGRFDYFPTRLEAAAHLDRLVEERDSKEQPRDIHGGSQRVDVFLVDFLNRKRLLLSPKTMADYTYQCSIARRYIGALRVDEVTRAHAQNMFDDHYAKGYKNLSQLRMVMAQAFDYALQEDYIRKNPFRNIKLPKAERRKNIALTEAQRDRLLAVLVGDPLEALFHLYSRLGLREGEGLALRWEDVNWSASTLTIARQYTAVRGKLVLRPYPKNKQVRIVPLPADILELLRNLSYAQRERIAKANEWHDPGLIFPSEVGTPIPPRNLVRLFKEYDNSIVKRAGLPEELTIHDLRHTAAYLLEQKQTPRSVRKAILGHLTDAMADHYTDHADMDAMRRAIGA